MKFHYEIEIVWNEIWNCNRVGYCKTLQATWALMKTLAIYQVNAIQYSYAYNIMKQYLKI